ncbi:MAG: hypothetical protein ACMG6E_02530 [Candidatus Roizmanbacteria bacterium]
MSPKTIVMIAFVIGSSIGGYIADLMGAGILSYSSVILSTIGGAVGIYIGYKMST